MACGNGPSAGTHALSDLPWASAVSGWGPVERDRSNGEQDAGDGRTLAIGGATYAKGLGVHADSEVVHYLGRGCRSLTVDVGVDDEAGGDKGSVVFQVYRDGTKVADSGRLTGADAPRTLTADLTGGMELRLQVSDGGDGVGYDHADWADPRLVCT
ncbi:NPCBM/NEW2 domain-containing protein [Streptomyces sp. NPDC051907]|uniref:NPCBM/NEW2 domain-containing protein n=1 Tax=Streptomyces sp. NPDC051907 TaxID=3155284 RepID=UPI003427244B